MNATTLLPLPAFYDVAHASRMEYAPDQQAVFDAAQAWRAAHGLTAAAADRVRVHLLLIDMQKDFCFPGGTLYVGGRGGRGAMEDADRIARFVYHNLGAITEITCTMDTHFPFQLFFASFWEDADGKALAPFREITVEQIRSGAVRPAPGVAGWLTNGNYGWLRDYVAHYAAELERAGKYALYLWPPHCLLGSEGHVLAGVIHEARLFHAYVRYARNGVEIKGGNAFTENYSVLAPEVLTRHDGKPLPGAQRNTDFIRKLLTSDAVVIAGEAASHCVKSSIEDLLTDIQAHDPALAAKVWVMKDCMSSVTVPDGRGGFVADYTPQAEAALARFEAAGMHVVESATPIGDWGIPGLD
jgi:nicotinamidase-related amidase